MCGTYKSFILSFTVQVSRYSCVLVSQFVSLLQSCHRGRVHESVDLDVTWHGIECGPMSHCVSPGCFNVGSVLPFQFLRMLSELKVLLIPECFYRHFGIFVRICKLW